MKAREEQTLELAKRLAYPLHYDDGHLREAEDMILESESRAEQRMRAEIAKRVSALFDSYDDYDRPCKQFVMEAIDAAREVG